MFRPAFRSRCDRSRLAKLPLGTAKRKLYAALARRKTLSLLLHSGVKSCRFFLKTGVLSGLFFIEKTADTAPGGLGVCGFTADAGVAFLEK